MFIILIIPILVSGFIVCNRNPYYSYKLHRYEGQYLYLKSAHLGLTSLVIVSIIALLLNKFVPSSISIFGIEISLDAISALKSLLGSVQYTENEPDLLLLTWILAVSIGAVIFSYAWSGFSNFRLLLKSGSVNNSKILLMSHVLSDSPLDKLLFDSYLYSHPLLLTLASRKVYVGTVSSLGEPNEREGMDQEISLIPLMSGFRGENDMKVEFSTNYKSVDSDLSLVIRQEQILTAAWFDFDVYDKLNPV